MFCSSRMKSLLKSRFQRKGSQAGTTQWSEHLEGAKDISAISVKFRNYWKVPEGPWLWLPLYVDIYNENPNANKLSWVINYWKVPEGPGHRHQGHQVVPGEPRTMDSGERHTGMNDMNLMFYKYHDWQRYPILLLLILHRWCILSETQGASLAHGPRLCGLKSSCKLQFFVDRCKRIWPWQGVYHLTGEEGF